MVAKGLLGVAVGAAVASAIGAVVSIVVERLWRNHKAKQRKDREEQ